jgi:hypothetical protein
MATGELAPSTVLVDATTPLPFPLSVRAGHRRLLADPRGQEPSRIKNSERGASGRRGLEVEKSAVRCQDGGSSSMPLPHGSRTSTGALCRVRWPLVSCAQALDGTLEWAEIRLNSSVDDRHHAVIPMPDDVSHRRDLTAGHLRVTIGDPWRKRLYGFANDEQVVQDRLESNLYASLVAKRLRELQALVGDACVRDGVEDVAESVDHASGHNGTASASAAFRTSSRRMSTVVASTSRPMMARTSLAKPTRGRTPCLEASKSTSRSTSEAGVSSPRAADPKTRTLRIRRRRAAP